ncbi:MAG: DUF58 domain-containing protein [Spirochaetaceae bacterium]|nr:MAG: DUF58 domain-containing protein [Spirochaetaceae bacterium]
MSFQGSPIKRLPRNLFSLTRWGIVFSLLSLMILVVGALRMELAAILWGSAFSLIALYCLLANRIMQSVLRRYFDKTPDPLDCTLPSDGVFPLNLTTAEVSADIPRYRAPGLKIGFEISLSWPGRDSLRLRSDLHGGRNRRTLEFTPSYRGCFQSREVHIVVADLLGFTRSSLPLPLAERLRVYPSVRPESAGRPPSREGGQEDDQKRRTRRSEELLEVRKYFPGDDIRKVHWKVFAHTSELFLRIGEETPPPESRFLVILDPAPSPVVPAQIAADYLDDLVERCAAAVLEALAHGFQVFFALCDLGQPREITVEKNRQLLAQLAGVWWSDRYALELPRHQRYQVLIFSSPGSGNLPRLFEELETRGGDVKLFFPQITMPDRKPERGSVRRLVLRPLAGKGSPSPQIGREELQRFRKVLDEEIGRWSRRGKWKVAVETI